MVNWRATTFANYCEAASAYPRSMLRIWTFFAACFALAAIPAHAGEVTTSGSGSSRYVSGVPLEAVEGIATYGPFRVVDGAHAALVGITDERSPAAFAAMLRDFPALVTLELVECPGTFDDVSNLQLGRMIRDAGLSTYVPEDGSVRSGGVELFFAGVTRRIDDGARFAVHAWMDDSGLEASDYSSAAPENSKYLSYYREMGMSIDQADAFYSMTNSVPHQQALWLSAQEMRGWVSASASVVSAEKQAEPQLAYLDLSFVLN